MANEDVQNTGRVIASYRRAKPGLKKPNASRTSATGNGISRRMSWSWSDETYRILAKSQERPMDFRDSTRNGPPLDRESLYRGVDEDLLGGVRPDAEFRIVRPNGEVRTVHSVNSQALELDARRCEERRIGTAYKLFGTVQDITERKREEAP